jgi:hypothetical protein
MEHILTAGSARERMDFLRFARRIKNEARTATEWPPFLLRGLD